MQISLILSHFLEFSYFWQGVFRPIIGLENWAQLRYHVNKDWACVGPKMGLKMVYIIYMRFYEVDHMMKKAIILLLCILTVILNGCSSPEGPAKDYSESWRDRLLKV